MLQFLYQGDHFSSTRLSNDEDSTAHFSGGSDQAGGVKVLIHVHIDAIAKQYHLNKRKLSSLQNFSDLAMPIGMDRLADLAPAIYACSSPGDGMRLEIVNVALDCMDELIRSGIFMTALAQDPKLEPCAGALCTESSRRAQIHNAKMGSVMDEIQTEDKTVQAKWEFTQKVLAVKNADCAGALNEVQEWEGKYCKLIKRLDEQYFEVSTLQGELQTEKDKNQRCLLGKSAIFKRPSMTGRTKLQPSSRG